MLVNPPFARVKYHYHQRRPLIEIKQHPSDVSRRAALLRATLVPLPNFERIFTRFDAVTHLGELSASFLPNEIWVMSVDPNQ
jgi:hypothetical protein